MTINNTPNNSFYKMDDLEIYTNNNGVRFLALTNHPVKGIDKHSIDITVEESSKDAFISTLKKADIKNGMSHLLQEGLLKELQRD